MESLSKAIAESTLTEDQVQMTIPSKKFKEWSASFEKFKSAFTAAKDEHYTVEEEDTRNRLIFQKLYALLYKHGFDVATSQLKGFTLQQNLEDLGMIIALFSVTNTLKGKGSALESFYHPVVVYHMIWKWVMLLQRLLNSKMMAIVLIRQVPKQLHQLCIVGIAADYKTSKAKMIKMDIDCLEETSIIKQSNEAILFSEALNSMLIIIQL